MGSDRQLALSTSEGVHGSERSTIRAFIAIGFQLEWLFSSFTLCMAFVSMPIMTRHFAIN